MNRDDIIQMALEAGLAYDFDDYPNIWQTYMNVGREEIERFAQLVAAAEREQCAKLVEPSPDHLQNPWHYLGGDEGVELLIELAQVIRSRGKP